MVEYEIPSKELIGLLRNGLVAFYPSDIATIFNIDPTKYRPHAMWAGYTEEEFLELASEATGLGDVKSIAWKVRNWELGKGLGATIPPELNELVYDYERQKAADQRATAKEVLLAAEKAKKEVPAKTATAPEEKAEEAPPATKGVPVETKPAEEEPAKPEGLPKEKLGEAPPKKEEPLTQVEAVALKSADIIGIKISYAKTDAREQSRAQAKTATTRWVIAHSYEKIRREDPEKAAAISMWSQGITSAHLEDKIKDLPDKHALELEKIVKAIKGLETDPIQTALMRQAFPIKDINYILGPETGITGSQVMMYYYPPEEGGVYVPQHTSFVGNLAWSVGQQLFKKWATKKVTNLLVKTGVKAVVAAGTEVTTAATGAAAGTAIPIPIVGTLIGLVVGFLVGLLFSAAQKFLEWLKKNSRDILFGSVAMLAYGGFIGSPVLIVSGAGLGLISGLNGGLRGTGKQIGGLGSTVINGMTTMAWPTLGVPFLIALLAVPVIVTIILVIINSGAYIVPPTPFSSSGYGGSITCSQEKDPVAFGNNSASPVSSRAWEIVSDLYQGFWCFWNRPPSSPPRPDFPKDTVLYPPTYKNLFNYELFKSDPNPPPLNSCGDCLFWCTYLVVKSYRESGNNDFQLTLWAPTMQEDWERRGKFISGNEATAAGAKAVKPGSVIFFKIASGPLRTNHVGIVHSVNRDAVIYVQSNAPTKNGSITFKRSGPGVIDPPGIGIVGFGLP